MFTTTQIQSDYAYCERIIKKHSKSFYYAFSKLPKQKAQAVYAIYAFCRIADDCIDESPSREEQLATLETLQMELDLFNRNAEVNHPLWRALRDVFNRFEMDIQPFYDQLTGQRMDLDFAIPDTLEQLERYSYYVAGSVSLMLLPIIASEAAEDLTRAAVNLGIAMQITNILRDVGEDFEDKGRIYLPYQEMRNAFYSEADLQSGRINANFIHLWEKLAGRAEQLYDQFQASIHHFDEDSRRPVSISAHVYREILNSIRDNDYDCFRMRNFVPKKKMIEIVGSACIGV